MFLIYNEPHLRLIQFVNPEIRNQENMLTSFFVLVSRNQKARFRFVKTHIVERENKDSSYNDFENQKSADRNQIQIIKIWGQPMASFGDIRNQ